MWKVASGRQGSSHVKSLTRASIPHARAHDHAKEHVAANTLIDDLDYGAVEFGFAQGRDEAEHHAERKELLPLH